MRRRYVAYCFVLSINILKNILLVIVIIIIIIIIIECVSSPVVFVRRARWLDVGFGEGGKGCLEYALYSTAVVWVLTVWPLLHGCGLGAYSMPSTPRLWFGCLEYALYSTAVVWVLTVCPLLHGCGLGA